MDISTNRIGCVVLEGGTDEIIEKIEENYDYTNLEKYVMIIFDSINL